MRRTGRLVRGQDQGSHPGGRGRGRGRRRAYESAVAESRASMEKAEARWTRSATMSRRLRGWVDVNKSHLLGVLRDAQALVESAGLLSEPPPVSWSASHVRVVGRTGRGGHRASGHIPPVRLPVRRCRRAATPPASTPRWSLGPGAGRRQPDERLGPALSRGQRRRAVGCPGRRPCPARGQRGEPWPWRANASVRPRAWRPDDCRRRPRRRPSPEAATIALRRAGAGQLLQRAGPGRRPGPSRFRRRQ